MYWQFGPKANMQLSPLDRLIVGVDQCLQTLTNTVTAHRPSPGIAVTEKPLTLQEKRHSAGLMRINHVGEVCAQALYQGQASAAKTHEVQQKMHQCAIEEEDHLAWCHERLQELNSHVSYLNPFWYSYSFMLGYCAGLIGDKWSLGFVEETENQVVRHLTNHLGRLPANDDKSRAVITQMRIDEEEHAITAINAGAAKLPEPVKILMKFMSKVMTTTAYWV